MQLRNYIFYLLSSAFIVGCSDNADQEVGEVLDQTEEIADAEIEWLSFEYDTAKAYYFDNFNDVEKDNGVFINGKLNTTIFNPEGTPLSTDQIVQVGKIMNGEFDPEEIVSAACFFPRHGIVFYESGEIVASISICFECNIIESSPRARVQDTKALEVIFQELEFPIYLDDFPERNP